MARSNMLRRREQGVIKQFLSMNKELFSGLRFEPMPESVNSLPKAAPGSVH
ncbi:hypothetical protein Ddye_020344 [Dipteronia dyeriana]|uniref:Uncharacterized protein n=1 Tax=Dipteronia dyeriana TaxID=168575 RepID=A0AAD9WVA3_9ROSI|nr:hypothetical protein Ddye_020344 [Dipteronia dyeriana]